MLHERIIYALDAYTKEIRKARHFKLLTGLPDAYGRGRIMLGCLPQYIAFGLSENIISSSLAGSIFHDIFSTVPL